MKKHSCLLCGGCVAVKRKRGIRKEIEFLCLYDPWKGCRSLEEIKKNRCNFFIKKKKWMIMRNKILSGVLNKNK